MDAYFLAFVPIFVAVDPLGILPVYLSLTGGLSSRQKVVLIQRSILTALVVAVLFLWVGKWVFAFLGITISDFLVAGGAILFTFALRDLLSSEKGPRLSDPSLGVVPLAVPLIVGPAVLTTSIIVLGSFGPAPTIFALVANILLCGLVLYFANALSRLLGESGSMTLSKIFSLLLGAIGVMLMRRGLEQFLLLR
ncbi:MAG: hypothetical protein A3D28_01415 [Omnitrophica bacterium RIFCSPHIGHO2_02_FULL_63_14]|nr:MAG: hypothetical protein A3D28_01415 [Omnitrophica bacterium RIFCSPHIGHO2_02_FULL_63_14]